jgi:hypothetical protein
MDDAKQSIREAPVDDTSVSVISKEFSPALKPPAHPVKIPKGVAR